jgi:hypothetical protein
MIKQVTEARQCQSMEAGWSHVRKKHELLRMQQQLLQLLPGNDLHEPESQM